MKALDTFRTQPFMHNCAQAVANRWKHLYGSDDIVAEYAPYRGGLAPDGLCGALFAAMQAVPEHADEIRRDFASAVGACHCRMIKGTGLAPCQKCVDTADRLVSRHAPADSHD